MTLGFIGKKAGFKELAVQPGNIDDGQLFGAVIFTFAVVGTVPKTASIHRFYHI
jgi:hypothetical protein